MYLHSCCDTQGVKTQCRVQVDSICSETTSWHLTETIILAHSYALYNTHIQPCQLCLDWEVHIPSACQGNRHKGPQEPICYCQTGPPPLLERHDILIVFLRGSQWNAPFFCCVNIEPHAYSKPHALTDSHYLSPGTIVTAQAIWAAVKLTISGERTWKYKWERKNMSVSSTFQLKGNIIREEKGKSRKRERETGGNKRMSEPGKG